MSRRRTKPVNPAPKEAPPKALPVYVLDEQDKVHKRATLRKAKCGRVLRGIWWARDWRPDNYPHCTTCMAMTERTIIMIGQGAKPSRPRTVSGGAFELGKRS
jgi:hypothetical protein